MEQFQEDWDDGYSSAVQNAREAGWITQEQADDLLEELVRQEGNHELEA